MITELENWIMKFAKESNAIEGIKRKPTQEEIDATFAFVRLRHIQIADLEDFVSVCQPRAILRDKIGLNVRIGDYVPMKGGQQVRNNLELLLDCMQTLLDKTDDNRLQTDIFMSPYLAHCSYEKLHPFTDGNGRSGRVLWLWQMMKRGKKLDHRGFLQTWYYQSLIK